MLWSLCTLYSQCMPGESYYRRLRSLLYLCYVFRTLINSLVCWFCIHVGRENTNVHFIVQRAHLILATVFSLQPMPHCLCIIFTCKRLLRFVCHNMSAQHQDIKPYTIISHCVRAQELSESWGGRPELSVSVDIKQHLYPELRSCATVKVVVLGSLQLILHESIWIFGRKALTLTEWMAILWVLENCLLRNKPGLCLFEICCGFPPCLTAFSSASPMHSSHN